LLARALDHLAAGRVLADVARHVLVGVVQLLLAVLAVEVAVLGAVANHVVAALGGRLSRDHCCEQYREHQQYQP
jgi:hypothetical protein